MIKLTRINGAEFVLNSELIKFIEETPDTIITLVNQEKVIVEENPDEIIHRIIEFRRTMRLFPEY